MPDRAIWLLFLSIPLLVLANTLYVCFCVHPEPQEPVPPSAEKEL